MPLEEAVEAAVGAVAEHLLGAVLLVAVKNLPEVVRATPKAVPEEAEFH